MFLKLTEQEMTHLRAFLDASEDCEALSEREYVADLYDLDAPLSLDLVFCEQGYYLVRPVTVAEVVRRALAEAGALPGGA